MTLPGRFTGELPPTPQLRDRAKPHSSRNHAVNITQRDPWRQGTHTPRLRVYRCFPSGLFLLTLNKSRPLLHHFLHQTQHNGSKCGMAHSQWSALCYWLRCNGLSILLKANITIRSWVSVHLLILPKVIPQEFPCPFTWAKVTYLYEHRPIYKLIWKVKWR